MENFTTADQVKQNVKQLLLDTDYTQLPDVNISNKTDFAAYRKYLRWLYNNPESGIDAGFPTQPEPQWIQE